MCLDAVTTSDSGKALIQLFHESAAAVMWDCIKRECKGPDTINVSDGAAENAKKQPPPPPSDEHAAAGSKG